MPDLRRLLHHALSGALHHGHRRNSHTVEPCSPLLTPLPRSNVPALWISHCVRAHTPNEMHNKRKKVCAGCTPSGTAKLLTLHGEEITSLSLISFPYDSTTPPFPTKLVFWLRDCLAQTFKSDDSDSEKQSNHSQIWQVGDAAETARSFCGSMYSITRVRNFCSSFAKFRSYGRHPIDVLLPRRLRHLLTAYRIFLGQGKIIVSGSELAEYYSSHLCTTCNF